MSLDSDLRKKIRAFQADPNPITAREVAVLMLRRGLHFVRKEDWGEEQANLINAAVKELQDEADVVSWEHLKGIVPSLKKLLGRGYSFIVLPKYQDELYITTPYIVIAKNNEYILYGIEEDYQLLGLTYYMATQDKPDEWTEGPIGSYNRIEGVVEKIKELEAGQK